jgi:hypothetical protein
MFASQLQLVLLAFCGVEFGLSSDYRHIDIIDHALGELAGMWPEPCCALRATQWHYLTVYIHMQRVHVISDHIDDDVHAFFVVSALSAHPFRDA